MPLFDLLTRLPEVSQKARVALSISPTLLEMLGDELLSTRLMEHITHLTDMAEAECERTRGDPQMAPLARMYLERFGRAKKVLADTYNGSLMAPLRELVGSDQVELLTTSATHAFLPNLAPTPNAVLDQIRIGPGCFKEHLGFRPKGFWLPDCGYYEGLDAIMSQEGISHTFLSSRGFLHSRPRPSYGLYRPVRTPSGLVAFGRERELSLRVWSAHSGYPAHPVYRDFYRDAGFDVDAPHIRDFVEAIAPGGHTYTGFKYHSITGLTVHKKPYRPEAASKQAQMDARHFADTLAARSQEIKSEAGFSPLFVLPFDAELFGHWWSEGPDFLEHFIKETCSNPELEMSLPSELAAQSDKLQEVSPSLSSWGEGGYGHAWSDSKAGGEALAEMLAASARSEALSAKKTYSPDTSDTAENQAMALAISQAKRELLLLQASDWGFLSHKETAVSYSRQRIKEHAGNLRAIYGMIESGNIDESLLDEMKGRAPIFSGGSRTPF